MNPEDIKVGDKVLVEAEVNNVYNNGDIGCFTQYTALDGDIYATKFDVLCSLVHKMTDSPANGKKNTDPAPKYDPCRKFREGDKAELREEINGRKNPKLPEGIIFEVVGDEDDYGVVPIEYISVRGMLTSASVMAIWLKLVQPVEELKPYRVHENTDSKSYEVRRSHPVRACAAYYYGGECPSYTKDAAKEAAEAERDRLNAEYRKEQNNG